MEAIVSVEMPLWRFLFPGERLRMQFIVTISKNERIKMIKAKNALIIFYLSAELFYGIIKIDQQGKYIGRINVYENESDGGYDFGRRQRFSPA